jgi:sugar diacid utilization regulator
MDLNVAYKKCLESIAAANIKSIAAISHEALGLPVKIESADQEILVVVPDEAQSDPFWERMRLSKGTPPDQIMALEQANVLQALCESDHPLFIDWGVFEQSPRIGSAIRSSSNDVLGTFIALCPRQQYSQDLLPITEVLVKTAGIILERSLTGRIGNSLLHSTFVHNLFSGQSMTGDELDKWERLLHRKISPPYSILALSTSYRSSVFVIKALFGKIQKLQHSLINHIVDDHMLVFCHSMSDSESRIFFKELNTWLSDSGIICGASLAFDDISLFHSYQRQAMEVLRVGSVLDSRCDLHYFHDYASTVIFSNLSESIDIKTLINPAIHKLIEFDKKNNTEYLETLKCWIENMREGNLVAKRMHIHRNTLLYRLNKIKEITDLDFSDPKTLSWLFCSLALMDVERLYISS